MSHLRVVGVVVARFVLYLIKLFIIIYIISIYIYIVHTYLYIYILYICIYISAYNYIHYYNFFSTAATAVDSRTPSLARLISENIMFVVRKHCLLTYTSC